MEYTFKKLVASLAAKQLSEDMSGSKTKGTVRLRGVPLPYLYRYKRKPSRQETSAYLK